MNDEPIVDPSLYSKTKSGVNQASFKGGAKTHLYIPMDEEQEH
jgi:hypothetical protein